MNLVLRHTLGYTLKIHVHKYINTHANTQTHINFRKFQFATFSFKLSICNFKFNFQFSIFNFQ